MAFLAGQGGLRTAVFLLAAQATHGSRWFAVLGGVAGIAAAILVGAGLYFSDQTQFGPVLRITGIFLVFIAAGLVMSSLHRAARRAGSRSASGGRSTSLDIHEIRSRR
jgi:high-affinity iron transporter